MNNVVLDGVLFKDPETKKLEKANVSVVNFAVLNGNGEKSNLVGCEAWGDLGKRVASLRKGDPIVVSGELKQSSWDDNGTKRSIIRIHVKGIGTIRVAEEAIAKKEEESADVVF